MDHSSHQDSAALLDAVKRLQDKQLMVAGDSLSQRVAGASVMLMMVLGEDVAPRSVALDASAPPSLPGWIYRQRPDVGAILIGSQHWAAALAQIDRPMPGIFDEQVRHLGPNVRQLGASATPSLQGGANAWLVEDRVISLGISLTRTVCNAELLEKCAKAYILAQCSGLKVRQIPWLVRFIAHRRLLRDQKFSSACYARGEVPVLASAY